jgi:hypothetical protein
MHLCSPDAVNEGREQWEKILSKLRPVVPPGTSSNRSGTKAGRQMDRE